mmetsp:Transcript_26074/g.40798  ORF Transcript_26074/g.40798 Transcript_26074/m.40798 type:complete len:125 (-) Transcript_26074:411-785(-)
MRAFVHNALIAYSLHLRTAGEKVSRSLNYQPLPRQSQIVIGDPTAGRKGTIQDTRHASITVVFRQDFDHPSMVPSTALPVYTGLLFPANNPCETNMPHNLVAVLWSGLRNVHLSSDLLVITFIH